MRYFNVQLFFIRQHLVLKHLSNNNIVCLIIYINPIGGLKTNSFNKLGYINNLSSLMGIIDNDLFKVKFN